MKKILLIILILAVVIGGGYFAWKTFIYRSPEEKALEKASEAAEKITESATSGVLPSFDVQTNPLEEKPNINPVDQTNPFKNIKINPFK